MASIDYRENAMFKNTLLYKIHFCETRSKRSVEVYRGKNLHPLPPAPLPHRRDRHCHGNVTDVTDIIN